MEKVGIGDEIESTHKRLGQGLVLTISEEKLDVLIVHQFLIAAAVYPLKPVCKGLIRDIIMQQWRSQEEWEVKEINPGVSKLCLGDKRMFQFVLNRRPWLVKGSL